MGRHMWCAPSQVQHKHTTSVGVRCSQHAPPLPDPRSPLPSAQAAHATVLARALRLLQVSFHKYGEFFPGTGAIDDIGYARGEGWSRSICDARGAGRLSSKSTCA